MTSRSLVWRQVIWPTPLPAAGASELLRRLAAEATRDIVLFEAISDRGSVSHFYATSAQCIRDLTQTIELVPGAVTIRAKGHSLIAATARVQLTGSRLPLQDARPGETNRQLLGALAAAAFKDEQVVLRVALGEGRMPRLGPAQQSDPGQSWPSRLSSGIRSATGETASRLRAKESEFGLETVITAGAIAKSEGRRRTILAGLLAAIRTAASAGTRLDFVRSTGEPGRLPVRGRAVLTVTEALSLMAWPLDGDDLPGMPPAHPRQLRLTTRPIETHRVFAHTAALGEPLPIGIGIEDALNHTHLLGPTNAGKSTAMLSLISHDMASGRSVVVIDPKSDLIRDVLERVPLARHSDVVIIDPSQENPTGLNPFDAPESPPELVADSVLNIIRDLFPSAFGPRTSDAVHASLLTLAGYPGATLNWLPQLFTDRRLRHRLLSAAPDRDQIAGFWNYYEGLSDGAQSQMVGPVLSRLRQFLLRPSLRRVLDQSNPKFQLSELFTRSRILPVPLNSGLLGTEAARLLGSLLVSRLQQLTLARANVAATDRRPVSVYVDEAQSYVSTSGDDLADALNRSRALGVAWHLAHQFRAQMPREVMAAIDTNCRNKIVFGLQSDDARAMAAMAPHLIADDFMALPRYGIYAHILRNGDSLGWILGATDAPPKPTGDATALRRESAKRYGRDEVPSDAPKISTEEASIGRRPRTTP